MCIDHRGEGIELLPFFDGAGQNQVRGQGVVRGDAAGSSRGALCSTAAFVLGQLQHVQGGGCSLVDQCVHGGGWQVDLRGRSEAAVEW